MSYSEFTIELLKEKFSIDLIEDRNVFPTPPSAQIPELLTTYLNRYFPLAITMSTEKARSELIIAPILAEFKLQFKDQISLFSGIDFNVDPSQGLNGQGLNGRCDYIISKSKEQLAISAPILVMVEAKNDNITGGIPQCIAEMIGAHTYNAQKKNPVSTLYGVVTTGSL